MLTLASASTQQPPELFPTRLRGKAGAVSTASNWIFNFALGYFVPPAFKNIQWKSYMIFGVFCFAMTVHVFLAFPESRGKTLEEVDEIFNSGLPAWQSRELTRSSRLDELAIEVARDPHAAQLDFNAPATTHSRSADEKEKTMA